MSKPTTDWRDSAAGQEKYRVAFDAAQKAANEDGYDRGIEANNLMKSFMVYMLPEKKSRFGHELRCQVVSCVDFAKIKPGHGP